MSEETFWARWDCKECGEKGISCEHKRCPSCGDARDFEEMDARYMPGDLVDGQFTEEQYLVEEGADISDEPDWYCTVCTASNSANDTICHDCDAPRGTTMEQLQEGVGTYKTFAADQDNHDGAAALTVEALGPYAGMRAISGLSVNPDIPHEEQLRRAAADRQVFGESKGSASQPDWDISDTLSGKMSEQRTHPDRPKIKIPVNIIAAAFVLILIVVGAGFLINKKYTYTYQKAKPVASYTHSYKYSKWGTSYGQNWEHELVNERDLPIIPPLVIREEVPPGPNNKGVPGIKVTRCEEERFATEKVLVGHREVVKTDYNNKFEVPCATNYITNQLIYKQKKGTKTGECRDNGNGTVTCPQTKKTARKATRTPIRRKTTTSTKPKYSPTTRKTTRRRTGTKRPTKKSTRKVGTVSRSNRPVRKPKIKKCYDYGTYIDHEPVYEYVPIYKNMCYYETQSWSQDRIESHHGKGFVKQWPELTLKPMGEKYEKETYYEITVSVNVDGSEESFTISPVNWADYVKYEGSEFWIKIDGFGNIVDKCHNCTKRSLQ